jgi:hypothetical protein
MPGSCERVLGALGQDPGAVSLAAARWGSGADGATVSSEGPLFPRVEDFE